MWGIPVFQFLITRGGVVIRMMDIILLKSGLGLGNSLGFVQTHVSKFARFQLACSCSRDEVMCTHTLSYASETTTISRTTTKTITTRTTTHNNNNQQQQQTTTTTNHNNLRSNLAQVVPLVARLEPMASIPSVSAQPASFGRWCVFWARYVSTGANGR